MKVVGLVLIGSARLSRSQNSYRAGAHCNLITLEVSALYSVYRLYAIKIIKIEEMKNLTLGHL
jgi:hypothetical protein